MWKHAAVMVALMGLIGCESQMSVGTRNGGVSANARTATYRESGDNYRTNMDYGELHDVGPGSDNSADYRPGEGRAYRMPGGTSYRTDTYRTETTYQPRSEATYRTDTTYRNETTYRPNTGVAARGEVSVGQENRTTYPPAPAPTAGVTARADVNTNTNVGPGSDNSADQARMAAERTNLTAGVAGALSSQEFVRTAASAGMFEVQSSRLALSNAQDPSVKDFAQRMIDDHTKANDKLKALAAQKNMQVPAEMLPQHKAQFDALKNLSGAAFDRAYKDAQMKAHQEAVSLFERASRDLSDSDLKSFASDTLPTLREHNDLVKTQLNVGGGMPANK